jgi:Tfp pilus assembly protein PilO
MSARDRIIAMVIAVVVILGAAWILVVSPERKQASGLGSQVSSAQSSLSAAEGQLAQAITAEKQYPSAYASVVSLGKAVPATQEVPSLIYEIEHASNGRRVEFASITSGGGTGASAASPSAAASPAATAAASAGFTQMPFTFVFNGTFFDLEHLFETVDGFAKRNPTSGALQVDGRLLTIQSVKLSPATSTSGAASSRLAGTITATAYVLPPSSAAATSSAAGAAPAPAASSPSAGSSAPPPAVVTP